jgi:hypothetical protein
MTRRLSIVNRHESNGVERPNQEILRHLRHLTQQEKVKHKWADNTVLPIVQFIINDTYNRDSGTASQGFSAFTLTFGNLVRERFDPNMVIDDNYKTKFVAELNKNFQTLHKATDDYQKSIAAKRLEKYNNPSALSIGDLVVRDPNKPFRKAKLNYYIHHSTDQMKLLKLISLIVSIKKSTKLCPMNMPFVDLISPSIP